MFPWSSGQSRHPFKVKNVGSNPIGNTINCGIVKLASHNTLTVILQVRTLFP